MAAMESRDDLGSGLYGSSTDRLGHGFGSSTDHLTTAAARHAPEEAEAEKTMPPRRRTRPWFFFLGAVVAALVIAGVVVGVLVAKNVIHTGAHSKASANGSPSGGSAGAGGAGNSTDGGSPDPTTPASATSSSSSSSSSTGSSSSASARPSATGGACTAADDIPEAYRGTYNDPTTWLDMTDFNCTFTAATVGNLSLVGLNTTWDDSKQANAHVPALDKPWGTATIRGVNLGGWLSLEPFITPSLFDYPASAGVVDEYTLCKHLGAAEAAAVLERHYATFVTEQDFAAMAAAGLSHVRIPYSYWAVTTYDGDPYVRGVSWRYLLRGIEWARKHGLRVNLDLHAVPGSQNGWNHSGRSGTINWIQGPDGAANAQRSLDLHARLAAFFAQPRYRNVVALYGLVNEPGITIPQSDLAAWTAKAVAAVTEAGLTSAPVVFSEALRGLPAWQGELQGYGGGLVVDVHEYEIFDTNMLVFAHAKKVSFVCSTFAAQLAASLDTATGFGPTLVGEWSQADTDCAPWVNGVGVGARWTGNFSSSSAPTTPACPTKNSQCSCALANQPAASYSDDYKAFLLAFAEAQMSAYETGWGWFYWTWKTENAPLWSYQAGLQGGFMPPLAYDRSWSCSDAVPSFGSLPEYY